MACGWCLDGLHDNCIGAIRINDDGLHFCDHPKRNPTLRCVDCSNKTPGEVDPEMWECLDDNHRGPHRLRAAAREIQRMQRPQPPAPKPRPVRATPGGKCLHCGAATKGGKFLPGHDSQFIRDATKEIAEGSTLESILARWAELGVSPALQNKLQKRVSNA